MDETNKKLVAYLGAHSHASAGELAVLVELTIPSIRYRLFQLMAKGIVGQEKSRNHRSGGSCKKMKKTSLRE